MQCMRCGRETAESEAFCPACLEARQGGGAVSESADRKSILWVEQKLHLRRSAEEEAESRPHRGGGLKFLLAVCLLALAATGYFAVSGQFRLRRMEAEQRDLAVREASVTLREKDASALERRIEELEKALTDEETKLAVQDVAVRRLEKLERTVQALENDNAALAGERDFWRSAVVFYVPGVDWYYHRFTCEKLNLTGAYQVYTPESAVKIAGLLPCPVCCGADR